MKQARLRVVVSHSVALATACLLTYWLTTHALSRVHSLSKADDMLGGLWAVLATLFVYRESHRQSVTAAFSRASATLVSFTLCLLYLLVFSFHPLGLAVLIGVGTFFLMAVGREEDVITAGITTTVVLVAAALSPHDAWEQPILRLADTAIGIAVGVGAAWITWELTRRVQRARGAQGRPTTTRPPGAALRDRARRGPPG
jgi:peptidoglycan/LPS O-acetylase OafA/YrhL